MSDSTQKAAARYKALAAQTAAQWAKRVLKENDAIDCDAVEQQTVAAVVLDLLEEVQQLREDGEGYKQLAFNLGSDLLNILQAAMELERGQCGLDELVPVGYAARGWLREGERIALADCNEGKMVTEWLEGLPDDHFARNKRNREPAER